jgi:hypothetical protein
MNTCESCEYYFDSNDFYEDGIIGKPGEFIKIFYGYCHRNAPIIFKATSEAKWPTVKKNHDWCGEYKPK